MGNHLNYLLEDPPGKFNSPSHTQTYVCIGVCVRKRENPLGWCGKREWMLVIASDLSQSHCRQLKAPRKAGEVTKERKRERVREREGARQLKFDRIKLI